MREIDVRIESLEGFRGEMMDRELSKKLQSPKPWVEKLKEVYNSSVDAKPRSTAISAAAFHMKLVSVINSINTSDNELDGCVWRLFDLVVGNDFKNGYSVENVLQNHMDKFFDDEEMFWEAYKTLVILDVIHPSYELVLTSIGDYISRLCK